MNLSMPERVELILRQVCAQHGVSPRDVLGDSRLKAVCCARFEAMYRIRTEIKIGGRPPSLPKIGSWFGRDHTSVLNALRRHGADMPLPRISRVSGTPPRKLQLIQDFWEAA